MFQHLMRKKALRSLIAVSYTHLNELLVLAEPTYQRFAMRLLPGTDHLLGVRLPKLRQMARKISKRDYEAYLQNNDELYFEEIMLKGMIIGYIKVPLDAKLELIRQFVPKINNWSVCDLSLIHIFTRLSWKNTGTWGPKLCDVF